MAAAGAPPVGARGERVRDVGVSERRDVTEAALLPDGESEEGGAKPAANTASDEKRRRHTKASAGPSRKRLVDGLIPIAAPAAAPAASASTSCGVSSKRTRLQKYAETSAATIVGKSASPSIRTPAGAAARCSFW